MELNRVDYALLKVLLKNDSVSFFKGMTIYEILDVLGGSRVTTYEEYLIYSRPCSEWMKR